jgi:hypothetical protein
MPLGERREGEERERERAREGESERGREGESARTCPEVAAY